MYAQDLRKEKITEMSLLPWALGAVVVMIIPLIAWQVMSPLHWKVKITHRNEFGSPTVSYGYCTSDQTIPFECTLAALGIVMLLVGKYMCDASRLDEDVIRDSNKINYAIFTYVLVGCIGTPVASLVYSTPTARFVVVATMILLAFGSPMIILMTPKVMEIWFPQTGEFKVRSAHIKKKVGPMSSKDPMQSDMNAAAKNSNGNAGISGYRGVANLTTDAPPAQQLAPAEATRSPPRK
jgi:hypothetical protein